MKKWLSWLLVLMMALSLVPTALAETSLGTAVARAQFNLRGEASTDAKIVGNVPQGAKVDVMAYGEDWCRVRYDYRTGYAKTSWLRVIGTLDTSDETVVSAAGDASTEDAASTEPADQTDDADALMPLSATPTDLSLLSPSAETLNGEPVLYDCMTRVKFNLRVEPDEDARRVKEIKKGADLKVLSYAEDWCKVATKDGKTVGYAKTKWLFHFASTNSFLFEVPGYEQYRMHGFAVMTKEEHITDAKNLYGGIDLKVGDIVFVKDAPTDTATILLRREFVTVPATSIDYTPVVNWREAKAGDIVGGYTQFFGQKQGGIYFPYRKHNIIRAMELMDGTIIESGAEYSFLTNVGPVTKGNNYKVAGITGGVGSGIGGGICHTSTLMYQAALSLPVYFTDREPHTDDGTLYAPVEFDATVGVYSDLSFINTLPYALKMNAYCDGDSGVITVQFECAETVDQSVLDDWEGTEVYTPTAR